MNKISNQLNKCDDAMSKLDYQIVAGLVRVGYKTKMLKNAFLEDAWSNLGYLIIDMQTAIEELKKLDKMVGIEVAKRRANGREDNQGRF